MAARKGFTEEQIISVLKRHEQGAKVSDLSREINVSDATIYKWLSKYEAQDCILISMSIKHGIAQNARRNIGYFHQYTDYRCLYAPIPEPLFRLRR